jgi:hypothetical protein
MILSLLRQSIFIVPHQPRKFCNPKRSFGTSDENRGYAYEDHSSDSVRQARDYIKNLEASALPARKLFQELLSEVFGQACMMPCAY